MTDQGWERPSRRAVFGAGHHGRSGPGSLKGQSELKPRAQAATKAASAGFPPMAWRWLWFRPLS